MIKKREVFKFDYHDLMLPKFDGPLTLAPPAMTSFLLSLLYPHCLPLNFHQEGHSIGSWNLNMFFYKQIWKRIKTYLGLWDNFEHQTQNCYRITSLSLYIMSLFSFTLDQLCSHILATITNCSFQMSYIVFYLNGYRIICRRKGY